MVDFTKGQIMQAVVSRLPYADQMKDIDLASEEGAIRFSWRGSHYRVSTSGHTEEAGGGVLRGSDKAILMQALVQFGLAEIIAESVQ